MRAPAFWWRPEPSSLARLLAPLGLAYGAVAARRMARRGVQAPVPVVCIGNFTAGGAGKTPTAIRIAALLQEEGETPAFLTRGYGGREAGPLQVGLRHRAGDVGDEPLLLARSGPVVVSRDRPAGVRYAAGMGATVIVMDDGLQNPSLAKDWTLAVVDGATGFGNRRTIPAGPLRAPLAAQWKRVDAVLVIGPGEAGDRVAGEALVRGRPVFRGALKPEAQAASRIAGRRVLAFAGIGRPEKFFETLRACGAKVEDARSFPDHHPFTESDLRDLRHEAKRRDLLLVTTEKDAARLGANPDVLTLPVALEIEHESRLRALMLSRLQLRD